MNHPIRFRNNDQCRLAYAAAGLTADGERPQYVHIDPDDYAGKIAAERAKQPYMTPKQRAESDLRIAWYEKRQAEQER